MSFLAPLYLLGATAIAAPIVLHLIRRAPRGKVAFSSLMYLSPSPPQLSKRSRLEHLLLLALRALALGLLALAFARPFLSRPATATTGATAQERVVILIDTSASLRRAGAWPRAVALAGKAIRALKPGDELAILAFDAAVHPVFSFAESRALDPAERAAVAEARLAGLKPTWRSTRLGQALIEAAAALDLAAEPGKTGPAAARRIVLVSDVERGGRLDELGDFQWPADVALDIQAVEVTGSNATLAPLADAPQPETPAQDARAGARRVLVSNEPGSSVEAFQLEWVDAQGAAIGPPAEIHVPAGESRVATAPPPTAPARVHALVLKADTHPFDNTLFIAEQPRETVEVLYLGDERAGDAAGLRYFLDRVFQDTPARRVRIVAHSPSELLAWPLTRPPALVVVAGETTPGNRAFLRKYLESGGTALFPGLDQNRSATLAALAGVPAADLGFPSVQKDLLLGEIAFDHPLFAPFAAPGYNDFTKIHFSKSIKLNAQAFGDSRVLARFESGDPAVLEKRIAAGRLIVMASGWRPAESQLARSSKFVPLLTAMLELAESRPRGTASVRVGDPVSLGGNDDAEVVIKKPDGSTARSRSPFTASDLPGVYTVATAIGDRRFAVNLDPLEGRTAPLAKETFEQYGCRLARAEPPPLDQARLALAQDAEQEGRQKTWRPLVATALAVLIVETWLAGLRGRTTKPALETQTP